MFPHNGTEPADSSSSGPTAGWDQWLSPEPTGPQATPEPAAESVWAPANAHAPVSDSTDSDTQWSAWLADVPEPAPTAQSSPEPAGSRSRKPVRLTVIGGVVAVVAVGAGVAVLMVSTRHTPAPALAVPTPVATTSAAPVTTTTVAFDPVLGGGPGCDPVRTPNLVRGNGTGAKTSAADVVLAFQHAYYVTRSGAAARAFTTPDAQVPTSAVIDGGIATIPPGTRYCVSVSPGPDGQWSVVVTETRPDTGVQSYPQLVTTTVVGGETLITRIGAAQ